MIENFNIETEYISNTSIEHRRRYAQFFTPAILAEIMTDWLLAKEDLHTVLEPAFGLGIFTRMLQSKKDGLNIKGFDVDERIFNAARKMFGPDVNLLLQDYMYNDWNNKYDGIICNPPYFKFHDYDNKGVIAEIEKRLSCRLNGFTNLYTLFLLKSIHQLNPGGRCVYIVPSEFLNSDYGTLVKSHLLRTKTLRHIIVFDFENNLFEDAVTTSCLILCENNNDDSFVRFSYLKSNQDIERLNSLLSMINEDEECTRKYHFSELDPDVKWKKYYQNSNSMQFKNLVPFSNYAKIMRGIATGANDYFVFSRSKAEKYGIDEKYLLPCISRCTDVCKSVFTESDFEKLKTKDKKVFLLNAIGVNDRAVLSYLAKGVEDGVDRKYLTSNRKPWYSLENRHPSPIWVSVFNRNGLRFVRNVAGVANLTTFHCVYPLHNLYNDVSDDLLFAYLQTDIAKDILTDNGREYGSGLQKFEPNDLNKGMMLDIARLPEAHKLRIENLYKDNIDNIPVKEVESILLDYFIN